MKHYWVDIESGITVGADLWDDGQYDSCGNEVWITQEPEFYNYVAYSEDGETQLEVTEELIKEATIHLNNAYWNSFD